MNVDAAIALAVLAGIAILVRTGRAPADLASFVGLTVLLVTGRVPAHDAFSGFACPSVIAVLGLSLVGAAVVRTGIVAAFGRELRRRSRGRGETARLVLVLLAGALFGAFVGPLLATAALMPAVASIARDADRSQSRVLLPLSTGAILGGASTGFGAPGTIVAATAAPEGLAAPGPFAFAAGGLVTLVLVVLWTLGFGRRLLPSQGSATGADTAEDLARVYRLHEHVFSFRVPPESVLVGRTLHDADLASLDLQVLAVQREDGSREAAEEDTEIRAEDILQLRGRLEDLRSLMRVRGVDVRETRAAELPRPAPGISAARARLIAASTVVGRTLREVRFRERFRVIVVGIERDGRILREHLGETRLREGDEVLVLGTHDQIAHFGQFPQWKVIDSGLGALQRLQDHLFLMRVHEGSTLAGLTLEDSRVGELVGLTIGGIIRDGETRLAPPPDEKIRVGDKLLVTGEPWRIVKLLEYGQVVPEAGEVREEPIGPSDSQVSEIAIAPRSGAAGRTVPELAFRHRYGLEVVGVWRGGRPVEDSLARIVLRLGDALLVQGPRERIEALANDADFIVLDAAAKPTRRRRRAVASLAALALLVGVAVSGWQPIHVAAFVAAALVLLAGAVRMEEAYRAVDWRTVLVIAAFVPISEAVDRSGLTDALAGEIARAGAAGGPHAAQAAFVLVAALAGQALGGAPAMLLLLPAAVAVSAATGIAGLPLVLGGALAATATMGLPRRFRSNVVVTGAGGYHVGDFVRFGLPVTAIVLAVAIWVVPLAFPF